MATDIKANATTRLHDLGQSLWLDNITRGLLTSGTLARYIDELSVTGLTSNPTIFDKAIENSDFYDDAIRQKTGARARSGEALFFELALEDLTEAADLFRPVHDAHAAASTAGCRWRSRRCWRTTPPSTHQGSGCSSTRARSGPICSSRFPARPKASPAIEEAIFAGVPINVTLLFSREQYLAAAEAYMRGIERRIAAGLDPKVALGRVDVRQPLGHGGEGQGAGRRCATASASPSPERTYKAYRELLASPRWQKLAAAGARPQRLLWASTGTKDPQASGHALHRGARGAGHRSTPCPRRRCSPSPITASVNGDDAGRRRRRRRGARRVRKRRASTSRRSPPSSSARAPQAFVKSWQELLRRIASKSDALGSSINEGDVMTEQRLSDHR